ncbi:uncharacterized protein LOC124164479 [Ischnura elegans]|uniref:uncharacterized protein LOC124164479 n=1 Tax=Ischnura elegans TaxID=197161 RepID=UPI001ED8B597|nr:uncharacterized protein LOC124164479 [Ischnura elegans]
MIRRRDLKLVVDVKVIPSDNVAPQHRPLVIDLRLDIGQHRRVRTTGPAHIKWWRLNDNKNQLKIALDHLSVNPDQPVAGLWRSVASQIQGAACEVLGRTKPVTRLIDKHVWWWNEDVQRIVKEKKMAFKKWRKTNDIVD